MQIINIAAHWKVFDRTGKEIDLIERELVEMVGSKVQRMETFHEENYDATFTIKGNIEISALVDACNFMSNSGAIPV